MPSIICRSTAGSLRPLPAICSASKIAGYKNVRFVPRSTCGFTDKATAEQAFNEFLDTGLYTQEQITFVRYIIDWLVQYGTLARQEMAYDEFSGGMDVTEVFEDNIILFQRIMTVVDNINANAMPLAA